MFVGIEYKKIDLSAANYKNLNTNDQRVGMVDISRPSSVSVCLWKLDTLFLPLVNLPQERLQDCLHCFARMSFN